MQIGVLLTLKVSTKLDFLQGTVIILINLLTGKVFIAMDQVAKRQNHKDLQHFCT